MTRLTALFLALVLSSCQANLTATVKAGSRATPATAAAASATPAAGVAATTKPAAPVAPVKLVRPAGATSVLAGRVAMDPAYAVGLAAGQLIGNDGASVLAAGSKLISNDGGGLMTGGNGGTLISNDGASIVAQGAGNVIAPAGLISQDGGSLIGNDGGSIITNDGASLVAKTRRLLADAAPATDQVPAAGMALYVRALGTHAPVALGRDAAGKPVYVVYTNLKGEYEVYLPADLAGNVEAVAFVPGKADPRMRLQQISAGNLANNPVDDNTTTITNYIRFGFRKVANALMTGNRDAVVKAAGISPMTPGYAGILVVLQEMADRVKARKIDLITDEVKRQRIANLITEAVLDRANLAEALPNLEFVPADIRNPVVGAPVLAVDPASPGPFNPKGTTAIGILSELLQVRRLQFKPIFAQPGTAARLAALPIVQEYNARDHKVYRFERASDYDAFVAETIVGQQLAGATEAQRSMRRFLDEGHLPSIVNGSEWFQAGFDGILKKVGAALFVDADVNEALMSLFDRAETL
ncbi:MAG: hypothetical protein JWM80_4286 [Cyanobacteria bacterium RYN_339]|nr:hypothetical protein [Cyanobacteria bacterium RYN_339]